MFVKQVITAQSTNKNSEVDIYFGYAIFAEILKQYHWYGQTRYDTKSVRRWQKVVPVFKKTWQRQGRKVQIHVS